MEHGALYDMLLGAAVVAVPAIRFTRLTNAFSNKVENHAHNVALLRPATISFASTKRFASLPQWPLA
jgi:hypothetical protein